MSNKTATALLIAGLASLAPSAHPQSAGHDFESLPGWSSSYEADWGGAASWHVAPDTRSGNALQVFRQGRGSSTRVLTYTVQPARSYSISVFMRCSPAPAYWAEIGFRLGARTARDFDANVGAWTMLQKCTSSSGVSGEWREYRATLNSETNDEISVGFKLGSSSGAVSVAFDELTITTQATPAPGPSLSVSASSLSATVKHGENPSDRHFDVQNLGSGSLTFEASADVSWLQLSPRNGASSGEKTRVHVRFIAATLPVGSHDGTILVRAGDAANSPQSIAVHLDVEQAGSGTFTFPPFSRSRLLQHFELYHQRSECTYLGGGRWAALETNISHPLLRDSSRRAIGYMRAASVFGDAVYEERARDALDYLLTEQRSDGHFTWWNSPPGSDNRFDTQYVTGTVGSALADGYSRYGDERYFRASEAAARWEASAEIGWNTNYVAFAMWHLAKHYGVSGERRWLDAAVKKLERAILPRQGSDGGFGEGAGVPSDLIGHNKRVWYHGIILRGLIELYRVMPADHLRRGELRGSIEKAVARTLDTQRENGEIPVGSGVPNEHRNAFILEALLLADLSLGIDTRDAVRGILQWRFELDRGIPQTVGFNIDIQALGLLLQRFDHVVADPPTDPAPPVPPGSPRPANPDFEEDNRFFNLARGWSSYGYGKREAFTESGHGWVQGLADFPEGGEMGIYQIVGGFEPGETYRLTADARVTRNQIGVAVGLAGKSTHDCHQARFSEVSRSTQWTRLSVEVTATEPWMTLFLRARNMDKFRISFDRGLFDNVEIVRVGSPPAPAVGLSRERLSASAEVGMDAPPTNFTVRNAGGGTLDYRIETNVGWLEVDPSEGRSNGEEDVIRVSFLAAGLAAGTHPGELRVIDLSGASAATLLPVRLEIREPGGTPSGASETFDTEPSWSSSFDASWGDAAQWRLSNPQEAQSGTALLVSRNRGGSSARVLRFDLEPNASYEISVFMKAGAGASNYWAELAYRLGNHHARSFDEDAANWTMVRKFSLSGDNGNGDRWEHYSVTFQSQNQSSVSIGFKLGSSGLAPTVGFDEMRVVRVP